MTIWKEEYSGKCLFEGNDEYLFKSGQKNQMGFAEAWQMSIFIAHGEWYLTKIRHVK